MIDCLRCLCLVLALLVALPAGSQGRERAGEEPGDSIVAIINQELVTTVELQRRVEAVRANAQRSGTPLPPPSQLREEALDSLIDERVIVTHARDAGWRIDPVEIDRALQSVAAQNQISVDQLGERLRSEGMDMARFRDSLRDQIMVERTREREVIGRIVVSDDEIDRELADRAALGGGKAELDIAQILVTVPEGADSTLLADRRARAEQALARVRAGEAFEVVAREMSEGPNRERGGAIGLRPVDRLPDLFVSATRGLAVGDVTPEPLRSPAGWHVLKLLDRKLPNDSGLVETHARHILLRTSDEARPEQAAQRLLQLRRQIESGARKFEDVAREVSEDGSAAQGGDLGWFGPGVMVPEFEEPLARLPVGAISDPVLSRFGVHLVQVLDRRPLVLTDAQKREQVRNVLRERKFKQAYADWVRELRSQAYIERRDTR
ncbi:MAG: peptidylprolyl isomerase [Rubrivivax sp.]|nr:peptidylprolyl isomerase [Rubrivivax sp.]